MALIHSDCFANLANKAQANDPSRKGQIASPKIAFGDYKRYAIYAVHTRFDAVSWFVADCDVDDCGMPGIIRQEPTIAEALRGL